jgi:hypothetical protein
VRSDDRTRDRAGCDAGRSNGRDDYDTRRSNGRDDYDCGRSNGRDRYVAPALAAGAESSDQPRTGRIRAQRGSRFHAVRKRFLLAASALLTTAVGRNVARQARYGKSKRAIAGPTGASGACASGRLIQSSSAETFPAQSHAYTARR